MFCPRLSRQGAPRTSDDQSRVEPGVGLVSVVADSPLVMIWSATCGKPFMSGISRALVCRSPSSSSDVPLAVRLLIKKAVASWIADFFTNRSATAAMSRASPASTGTLHSAKLSLRVEPDPWAVRKKRAGSGGKAVVDRSPSLSTASAAARAACGSMAMDWEMVSIQSMPEAPACARYGPTLSAWAVLIRPRTTRPWHLPSTNPRLSAHGAHAQGVTRSTKKAWKHGQD